MHNNVTISKGRACTRCTLALICSSLCNSLCMYYAAAMDTPDNQQHEIVQMLLVAGCNPNASDELNNSVLARAFTDSSPSIVSMLLEAGAVMWDHEKSRVIDALCRNARPSHMQLLLEHSEPLGLTALITLPRLEGMLHTAARVIFACDDLINLLLQMGAHVDARDSGGLTPLMAACASAGRDSTIESLVLAGADVNLVSPSGATALLLLCRERPRLTSHAVTVLLEAGAFRTLMLVDAVTKQSCLHCLALRSGRKRQHLDDQRQVFECVARLAAAGADTRPVDVQGRNCLHYAYMNGALKEYNVPMIILQHALEDEVKHKDVYGKIPKDYEHAPAQAEWGGDAGEEDV